jgi:hypothetical protein
MPARVPGTKSAASQPNPNPPTNGASSEGGRCTHPRVQIVARQDDAEYVECLECREVFESSEFQDMAIEEKIEEAPSE